MTALEIEALVSLGTRLFGLVTQATATLQQIKDDHPEIYVEIGKRYAATDADLRDASRR